MTMANTSARAAISAGKLKIETGLDYRANEAAINGDDGGESCLGGVRGSSREMNCIAHSRTRTRTQVEVASDSTVREDSFVQFGEVRSCNA